MNGKEGEGTRMMIKMIKKNDLNRHSTYFEGDPFFKKNLRRPLPY